MPQVCTVCQHVERDAIDAALVSGEPNRRIATQFGLAEASVRRHRSGHLPSELSKAREAAEIASADSLLDRLRALNRETADVLKAAKASGDHTLRLRAIARVEKQIELEGRLLGELQEGQSVINVLVMPEFLAAQRAIVEALSPYPAARLAVAEALSALGTGSSR